MSASLARLVLASLRPRAAPLLAARASGCQQRRHHSYSCAPPQLNPTVFDKYMKLDTGSTVMATYVWIDGTGEGLRSKTRSLPSYPKSTSDLPFWGFDGSSTGQAKGHDSDVELRPVQMYKDPFIPGDHVLVMCETYQKDGTPHPTNFRHSCVKVMERVKSSNPLFGLEQEYTFLDTDMYPLGWPKNGFPGPQGPYYCSVGANCVYGRQVVEAHYVACLFAGLTIAGTNAEVMPGQWEYQVGPCRGVDIGDETWISRYILHRVSEDFGAVASLDPKPMPGDWNGAGAHVNFSTNEMLAEGGLAYIKKGIEKLEAEHGRHIQLYDPNLGNDNSRRLTGLHETAHRDEFSSGVAHRGASIRIPRHVSEAGKGYLEDRRPSSNCDPYLVSESLVRTIVLDDWSDFTMPEPRK